MSSNKQTDTTSGDGDASDDSKTKNVKPRKVFEEEINTLWANITMYTSGIKHFEGMANSPLQGCPRVGTQSHLAIAQGWAKCDESNPLVKVFLTGLAAFAVLCYSN